MKRDTDSKISQLEGTLVKMQRPQAKNNWTVRLGEMAETDRRK